MSGSTTENVDIFIKMHPRVGGGSFGGEFHMRPVRNHRMGRGRGGNLHKRRTVAQWTAVCSFISIAYSDAFAIDGDHYSGDKGKSAAGSSETTMRSEGRLSPQRPRRLRTEKRVTSKLVLIHSKLAKQDTRNRPARKQRPALPLAGSL